jgi:polyhydroxybutyrate depolymerase
MTATTLSAKVADDTKFEMQSGGVTRTYTMHMPDNLSEGRPLVVYFHGYNASIEHETDLDAAADRHGFAVCYPEGTCDSQGKQCWNVGYPFQADMTVDDVQFTRELVKEVCQRFDLNRKNVFCTGMSNGGEMCYVLSYQAPGVFAAYGSVSGLTMEWLYNTCEARQPVPFLEIHGTEDRISEWLGDPENKGGWGSYIAVPVAVGYWVTRNRCITYRTEPLQVLVPDEGLSAVAHIYTGTDESVPEVRLYEVIGGSHTWYGRELNTGELLWQFFSKYVS